MLVRSRFNLCLVSGVIAKLYSPLGLRGGRFTASSVSLSSDVVCGEFFDNFHSRNSLVTAALSILLRSMYLKLCPLGDFGSLILNLLT